MILVKQMTRSMGLLLAAAILFAQSGCALVTTRRVAMTAGKFVGKKVYEEAKEKRAEDERNSHE